MFETLIQKFQGNLIDFQENPIEKLIKMIKSKFVITKDINSKFVESLFVKLRFHHRIKIFNESIKADKAKHTT